MEPCRCATDADCHFPHEDLYARTQHHLARGKSEHEAERLALQEIELRGLVAEDEG